MTRTLSACPTYSYMNPFIYGIHECSVTQRRSYEHVIIRSLLEVPFIIRGHRWVNCKPFEQPLDCGRGEMEKSEKRKIIITN